MSVQRRKVGFYSLTVQDLNNNNEPVSTNVFSKLLNDISKLNSEDRILDLSKTNKFHLLHQLKPLSKFQNIVFASAKYHHRPPLINKNTAGERDNPKRIEEGELEKTHISFKYLKDEIILLLEERAAGISIGTIRDYFNTFLNQLYNLPHNKLFRIEYAIIPKGDFFDELENLKRVCIGQIYSNKAILGSEFLNFANRVEPVQDDIIITIKAKRKKTIKDIVSSLGNKLLSNKMPISKIRVYGYSQDGNQVMLDTDIIKMTEYVDVEIKEDTGIVNSLEIFSKFNSILSNM